MCITYMYMHICKYVNMYMFFKSNTVWLSTEMKLHHSNRDVHHYMKSFEEFSDNPQAPGTSTETLWHIEVGTCETLLTYESLVDECGKP